MAEQGFVAAVNAMVDSAEYTRYFGVDVVPYHRLPSLPAANHVSSFQPQTSLVK